jgi:hypothetical protein
MPRYYGPSNSTTERDAMRNLCKPEQKPRPRTLVWREKQDPVESLKRFIEKEDSECTDQQ